MSADQKATLKANWKKIEKAWVKDGSTFFIEYVFFKFVELYIYSNQRKVLIHKLYIYIYIYEQWRGISNNVVCETSKASDPPAHICSLIRVFASRSNIL